MARVLALSLLLAAAGGTAARVVPGAAASSLAATLFQQGTAAHRADGLPPQPLLVTRPLPPFTAVDLGAGCWPLSLHVAPGPAPALELSGGDDDAVLGAAIAAIAADVSVDGVLTLRVLPPGFAAPLRGELRVTLRVPDGELIALSTAGAAVLVSAVAARDFQLAVGDGSAPVVLRRSAAATTVAGPGTAGSLVVTVTQGTQPVAVCSTSVQALSFVSVTNNAQADVRVENFTARSHAQALPACNRRAQLFAQRCAAC
jgi:hypothetical protein